jgi:hypothetical protein
LGRRSVILGVWAAPAAAQTPIMTDVRPSFVDVFLFLGVLFWPFKKR